jgi:hypothetical protein
MEQTRFEIENKEILKKVEEMLRTKGEEYQADSNVLSNFETNASRLGLTSFQIWAVYFNKHVESINSSIKKNPHDPSDLKLAEPLQGRVVDAIAYLLLLNSMIKKAENKENKKINNVYQ